jgi:hypothetical protein
MSTACTGAYDEAMMRAECATLLSIIPCQWPTCTVLFGLVKATVVVEQPLHDVYVFALLHTYQKKQVHSRLSAIDKNNIQR